MQTNRVRLTSPEAARALYETPVLHKFLAERNPSDVAREIGMPANLVHHHVKRGVELGLLLETRREAGRVYYQLAAREFTHARSLLGMNGKITRLLESLSGSFLEAYRKSEAETSNADDPDYDVIGFQESASLPIEAPPRTPEPVAGHPAHFQSRTLQLSAASYQTLVQQISVTIAGLTPEETPGAANCTLTLIGFQGELRPGHDNSQSITSFVPLPTQ